MDVTEEVDGWPDLFDFFEEIFATRVTFVEAEIENSKRRPVGDDDVGVIRNHRPFFGQRTASWKVEGPIVKLGLPGTSINFDPIGFNFLVDETVGRRNEFLGFIGVRFKTPIVISRDKNLHRVRLFLKKTFHRRQILEQAPLGYITGVQKNIAVRNGLLHPQMNAVGITDANDLHLGYTIFTCRFFDGGGTFWNMINRTFAFLCLLASPVILGSEISTVAGPEGVNNPFGVIVGLDGDVYFCDTGNHQIKRIAKRGGKITTVVGTGKKGYSGDGGDPLKAELFEPYEVRFHPNGDLYWVEMQNHIVRKLDARTNLVSTVAGTGEKGFSGDGGKAIDAKMNRPHSIQFNQSGDSLFVCDIGNQRVRRIDLNSGLIETWCGNGKKDETPDGAKVGPETPLKGPRALDIDPTGSLWLALREGNKLLRIDMKGKLITHVAGNGKKGFTAEGTDARKAPLSGPKGVAISPNGTWVYLADTESHTVRAVNLETNPPTLHTVAGDGKRGDGPDSGDPLKCQMARLHGVGTDPLSGDLFIGDSETNKVRKISGLPGGMKWKSLREYSSREFQLNGVNCRLTSPAQAAPGNPWIWRCRFYGAFPGLDETLLAMGWHVAWIDSANLFGGPKAMERFDAFYTEMTTKFSLGKKPVMEGFSRGGLPATNWAIQNPDKVLALYLDAAVMDIHSWPGPSSGLYKTALGNYELTPETAKDWKGPLENLSPLARAKIPVFIVAGGADPVVPFQRNTGKLEARYRELGGPVQSIVKATCSHHPHGLYGPANFPIARKLNDLARSADK